NCMFRPVRMLQLGAVMFLLAGCASGNTPQGITPDEDTVSTTLTNHGDAVVPAASAQPLLLAAVPKAAPSIQAGSSVPSASGFTQVNGELTPDIKAYADEVARTRNIPQASVQALLQDARYDETVARLMSPSKTRIRPSWVTYRKRF